MITVTDLTKVFDKEPIFTIPHFTLPEGITCLGGPSGCGKTTFARLLAGLEKPTRGSIVGVEGDPTVLFQEPRLLPTLSAVKNVACVLTAADAEAKASALLTSLGFRADDLLKRPSELSGGMAQRTAITRALLFAEESGGNLVILDEPFRGLDPEAKAAVAEAIVARLSTRHVLLITHDSTDATMLRCPSLSFSDIDITEK